MWAKEDALAIMTCILKEGDTVQDAFETAENLYLLSRDSDYYQAPIAICAAILLLKQPQPRNEQTAVINAQTLHKFIRGRINQQIREALEAATK